MPIDFQVNVNVQTKGAEKIDALEKQIKALQNSANRIKINFDVDNLNTNFENQTKTRTTALQRQIESVARTQRNAFSQPLNNMTKQQKSYSDWWNKQFENQDRFIKAQQKLSTLSSFDIGKYYGTDGYSRIENYISKANELEAKLNSSLSEGLSKANIDKFNSDLAEMSSLTSKAVSEFTRLEKPISSLTANQAGNNTLKWLESNTKAAKEYGDALKDLAQRQKQATTVGEADILKKQVTDIQTQAKIAGKTGNSLFTSFKNSLSFIGQLTGAFTMIQNLAFDIPEKMVKAVTDVNKAQIELTKVSNAPASQLNAYWDEAAESAKKYGATISDVITSTADWSRLGYNLEESKYLSDMTTLYQNVGDNMTQESASKSLVSTLQGFELDASEAGNIVDKFNEVANNYAIDTAGIGEALQKSAASFNVADTSLSKSIALITGANEVVQDPSRVGNMWKTVGMRIRGAKSELEEAGEDTEGMVESTSKLREIVKAMTGFDIMKDEAGTQFKDLYDIVVGIGKEWKNLSSIDQASLLEILAGKHQGNALAAALSNIDTIQDVYKTAEFGSEGSAERELENWNKGIEASIQHFKAQFQDFATTAINSDFLKGIVDAGTQALEIITQLIDSFGMLKTLIGGFAIGKGISSFIKNFDQPKITGCYGFPIFPYRVYYGGEYAIKAA